MTVSVYPPRSAQAYANAACTKTHHQHRCSGAAKIHEATESQATQREVEGQQADAHRMPHRLPSPRSIHPLPAPPVPHVSSLAVSHLTHSYNKKDKTQGMHGAQVSHIPPCSLVDGSTDAHGRVAAVARQWLPRVAQLVYQTGHLALCPPTRRGLVPRPPRAVLRCVYMPR